MHQLPDYDSWSGRRARRMRRERAGKAMGQDSLTRGGLKQGIRRSPVRRWDASCRSLHAVTIARAGGLCQDTCASAL